jgi:chromosome segregation ATPase
MHCVLLLILFFCGLTGYAQVSKSDTLETVEELRTLRSQIAEKIDQLKTENGEVQLLLDSCQKKLFVEKSRLSVLRSKGANLQARELRRLEKEIEVLETELKEIMQRQVAIQEVLTKATKLMSEIDDKIAELLRGSEMLAGSPFLSHLSFT